MKSAKNARPPGAAPVLSMRGVTKRYATGTLANEAVDFEVRAGEIHALLGENGAGKSTLMHILYGLVAPDSGEIAIDGHPVTIADPADAIARGVGMVHQHFMLVPVLTVAENVVLGRELVGPAQVLDRAEAARRVRALAERLGFALAPEERTEQLSVGQQQRVEILKSVYRGARILVLDEPTAVLTPQETREIFTVLRRLADEGAAIVFISHKLEEVLELADRITVIRRGKVVGQREPRETTADELAELMVGREVSLRVDRGRSRPAEVRLAVHRLRVAGDRGHEAVRSVDLDVRAGEILGIAGVAGNGQEHLVECVVGLRAAASGTIHIDGRDVTKGSIRQRRDRGLAYVPADRQRAGLVLAFSVRDNLALTTYEDAPLARGVGRLLRDRRAIDASARGLIERFDVRTPSPSVETGTLSGGNQQKVVVAREFRADLRLLVLDQPTRGLDVGSIEFIHRQVLAQRDAGTAILLVSAELDEVLQLADRVAVMYRGSIVATLAAAEASRDRVGRLMATGAAA
ncbi:MAG: ABC transporter ATP-binding protein [Candidatus Limnocylindria bacterium]